MIKDKEDLSEEYFKKVTDYFSKLNRENDFKLKFTQALAQGKVKLSHQTKQITRIYQDDWLNTIEYNMPFLETIVYNHKKFIKREELLVPVELAKKTGKESIQHLLANTQYIDDYNKDKDEIRPGKILTVNSEEDIAIYENRFIKMLAIKLKSFVDYRYRFVSDRIVGRKEDFLLVECDTKIGGADFKCKMEFQLSSDEENEDDSREIYNNFITRIENARGSIYGLFQTEFMKELEDAKPIVGQIEKTNIISKEVNYKAAFDLWTYIGNYEGTGFDIQVTQEVIPFDDYYKNQIYNLLMLGYTTFEQNAKLSFDDGFDEKIKRVKTLSPIIDRKFKIVEQDYIYEEEIPIPSKIMLLEQIKEEQMRLEKELEKKKELERKAKEKLTKLRGLAKSKWKIEQAKIKADEEKREKERLLRIKQKEEEKILLIVREKELKIKETKEDLNRQIGIVKEIKNELEVYNAAFSNNNKDFISVSNEIEQLEEEIKVYKENIVNKEKVAANKNKYYSSLFKLNELKSKLSDLKIIRKESESKVNDLEKELESEINVERKIREFLSKLEENIQEITDKK